MLPDRQKLKEIILHELEKYYPAGDAAGGSGHLSHSSIELLKIEEITQLGGLENDEIPITFLFRQTVVSEFTDYIDSFPRENYWLGSLVIKNDKIVGELKTEWII